jgi:hypothetical protein
MYSVILAMPEFLNQGEIINASHKDQRNFPVVCVGGSAGGLDAYSIFPLI